ncbi:hypothetical protein EOA60_29250, partial [Mesorhizobium sp. M1A.F.Ca.IN.020.06.1.1]
PSVVAAAAYFGTSGFDKTFELGLEMFLDEMERIRDAARDEAAKSGDRARKKL